MVANHHSNCHSRASTSQEKSVSHVMHGKRQTPMAILLSPVTGLKSGHLDSGA